MKTERNFAAVGPLTVPVSLESLAETYEQMYSKYT